MTSPTQEELDTIPHKTLTRDELLSKSGSRMCVCGRSWSDSNGVFYCNNTHCVYWNICTREHSTSVSRLDILYELVYMKGFCKCKDPKYHESIEDYEICINKNCFAVLREYEKIVIDESLYPREMIE